MIGFIRRIWSNQSNDVQALGKGVFWTMSGSVLSRGALFLAWILIARILGKELYGEYGLIRNTILMFATFAGSGMGQAATKFVAEFIHKDREKAERIAALITRLVVITAVVVFVVALVSAPYVATVTMKAPWLVNDFRIAAFVLLFSTLNTVQIGILEGLGRFKNVAYINLVNALISLPLFVSGAYFGEVSGSIIAYGVSTALICIMSGWQIRRLKKQGVFNLNYAGAWREKRLIWTFILPAILSGVVFIPLKWGTDVMLVNHSGFGELGIFTAALTINMIVIGIATTINSPFLNIIAKNKGENNLRIERLNIFAPWFIGIAITLPLACFPGLGTMLFGKQFVGEEFTNTFIIVLLFTLIMMYKQGFSRLFALHNLQWIAFLSNTMWGVILIVGFVCLKSMGAVGLATAYAISYVVTTVMLYPFYIKRGYVKKELVFSPFVASVWGITFLVYFLALQDLWFPFRVLIFCISAPAFIILFYKEIRKI